MNIFNLIKNYQKVCIYRHVNPDLDALGSQYGMACIIKQLFPDIKICIKGEVNEELLKKLPIDEQFDQFNELSDCLAIITDTANKERIDGNDYQVCKEILKIDHHIVVDSYGNYNIEFPQKSSASQIIVELFQQYQTVKLNIKAASCLYMGMIADSNRFMYSSTDALTLKSAAYLLECGINIEILHQQMYMRKEADLKIQQYILNHYYHNDLGIAYYVLSQIDLEKLNITRSRGSDFVNLLANIEEYQIWLAVTENVENNTWRVSMRSRQIPINEIAAKFNGGGHQLASGATLNNFEELDLLIEELENTIRKYQ